MEHTLEIDRNENEKNALTSDVQEVVDLVKSKEIHKRYYASNPYAVLAAAAGVGYVLGGGLNSRFTGRLMRIGMKALIVPLAASQLKNMSQKDK